LVATLFFLPLVTNDNGVALNVAISSFGELNVASLLAKFCGDGIL
jgi:hypothetical protein